MEREKHICEAVPYYHRLLPYDIVTRYKWYFEYMVARIKVKHPKRRVIIQYIEDKLPTKEEQITKKRNDLLRAKIYNIMKNNEKKSKKILDMELEKLKKELESYQKNIFDFNIFDFTVDFIPAHRTNPKESGYYITIRCGFSGIYQVVNYWRNGNWLCSRADGSQTIAFSRNPIELKSLN